MRASTAAGSNVLSIMTETGRLALTRGMCRLQSEPSSSSQPKGCRACRGVPTGGYAPAEGRSSAAAARDALDLGTDQALHERRQVLVEPGLEHRSEHLGHGIFKSPGTARGNRPGQPAKG